MKSISDNILALVNSWKYKRAQPYKIQELKKIIEESVLKNQPIRMFGYWGVGNKKFYDDHEINTIKYLNSLKERVAEIYEPGLDITFIISDVHAKNNAIRDGTIRNYSNKIHKLLLGNGYRVVLLSGLYAKYGLDSNATIDEARDNNNIWWQFFALRKDLLNQAKKVSLYQDKNISAKSYAIIRKKESEFLEKEYAEQIFITYSPPHYRILYPDLPTMYLYSERKGCSEVPWFN